MYAAMCTTPKLETLTAAFSQVLPLKTFQKTGCALSAALAKVTFRLLKTNFLYYCTIAQ